MQVKRVSAVPAQQEPIILLHHPPWEGALPFYLHCWSAKRCNRPKSDKPNPNLLKKKCYGQRLAYLAQLIFFMDIRSKRTTAGIVAQNICRWNMSSPSSSHLLRSNFLIEVGKKQNNKNVLVCVGENGSGLTICASASNRKSMTQLMTHSYSVLFSAHYSQKADADLFFLMFLLL